MTCEQMRKCGWRKDGLYLMGNGATVGGSIVNDCRFVRLEPIPFPKEAPNPGRGFVYVDGQAILEGRPPNEWGLSPSKADLLKLSWEIWGLSYEERRGMGVCEEAADLDEIQTCLEGLGWVEGSAEKWPNWMKTLIRVVDVMRQKGDCPLVPAIMEVRRMMWQGPLRKDPATTLAYCHRLVTELSWVGPIPKIVLDTVAEIMKVLGAGADVPLLEKFCTEYEEESL